MCVERDRPATVALEWSTRARAHDRLGPPDRMARGVHRACLSTVQPKGTGVGIRETDHDRLSSADFELKFVGEPWRTGSALRWLRLVCLPDPSFPESTVFTVYYDTPTLDCLLEKRNSDYLKTKIRLRWYRVGDRATDSAFLEVKSRYGSRREKLRVTLPFRSAWQTRGFLDTPSLRDVPGLLRPEGLAGLDDYRPVLQVRYRRHRFIEPQSGLRISLDSDIRAPAVSRAGGLIPNPLPLPTAVFELKGRRDHFPERLQVLTRLGFRKASFSKYAACYDHALAPLG